jgi:hypothetical protein
MKSSLHKPIDVVVDGGGEVKLRVFGQFKVVSTHHSCTLAWECLYLRRFLPFSCGSHLASHHFIITSLPGHLTVGRSWGLDEKKIAIWGLDEKKKKKSHFGLMVELHIWKFSYKKCIFFAPHPTSRNRRSMMIEGLYNLER